MLNVQQRAANAIEKAIVQGHYDPGKSTSHSYMCVVLTTMHRNGLVDTEAYLHANDYIHNYLRKEGTMVNYVFQYDVNFDRNDTFLWRIFCSNHFWKIIRKLRGEAPLEVEHA